MRAKIASKILFFFDYFQQRKIYLFLKKKINGKNYIVNNNYSLNELINKLDIPKKMVAIELNKKIVDKNKLKKIILKQKDCLEIVHFIGGG